MALQMDSSIAKPILLQQNIEKQAPMLAKKETIDKSELRTFIEEPLVKFTTISSVALNLLSAPVRLFSDDNPLKKIINHISMLSTKLHLLAYSAAGLFSATEQKNPLLIFSYLTEGLAAVFKLGNIYLFRGIATGIDGMVAGIKDKDKRSHYQSYAEGWNHSWGLIKDVFQKTLRQLIKTPLELRKMDGDDLAIFSSGIASIGGLLGMTVHEKIGATVRDIAGVGGDYGLARMDSQNASKSGYFYLAGSILDYSARIFNKGIAKLLNVDNTNAFDKIKAAFLEAAIAFDKIGQFFFLRYNQESENTLQQAPTSKLKTPNSNQIHAQALHTAMAV
ncbi:MAG: hypothetical protein O2962_01335 [Cyanobacteria bacterium]|nr:hypothetical protein [Cyanobacteriota bacterium]